VEHREVDVVVRALQRPVHRVALRRVVGAGQPVALDRLRVAGPEVVGDERRVGEVQPLGGDQAVGQVLGHLVGRVLPALEEGRHLAGHVARELGGDAADRVDLDIDSVVMPPTESTWTSSSFRSTAKSPLVLDQGSVSGALLSISRAHVIAWSRAPPELVKVVPGMASPTFTMSFTPATPGP